jgi:hypothetical protein
MAKLRDITGQYKELLDLANSDEIPAEAIRDTLQAIEGEFEQKAIKVADVIHNIESDISQIDKEIKRLQARKKVVENRKESIRDFLINNMEACNISKISCPLFTITLVKGRDVVVVDDEDDLPDQYITVKTSTAPDKAALLAALKEGTIDGAHLEKSKPSLRIK